MATLSKTQHKIEIPDGIDNFLEWEDQKLADLSIQVKAKRPNDPYAGEYWRHGVGDGYAVYIIESSKPLKLAHVRVGDAWQVPYSMIRGLRLADVAWQLGREKELAKIFGRAK